MLTRLSRRLLGVSNGWTLAAATLCYVLFLATVMPEQSAMSRTYAGEWGAPDRQFFRQVSSSQDSRPSSDHGDTRMRMPISRA